MADAGDRAGDLHLAVVNAGRAGTARLGVVSLCLVQFVDVLGVTVMVTALPAMLADLHTSADAAAIAWGTAALISFTGAVIFGLRNAAGTTAIRPAAGDMQTTARENHPRSEP